MDYNSTSDSRTTSSTNMQNITTGSGASASHIDSNNNASVVVLKSNKTEHQHQQQQQERQHQPQHEQPLITQQQAQATEVASKSQPQQPQAQDQTQQPQPQPQANRIKGWPTLLHKLIGENETEEWTLVLEHIHQHPNDVGISGKAFLMTPLHVIGYRQPTVPVIKAMLQAKPRATCEQNIDGETPLHIVVSALCDEDVIQLLIEDGGACAISKKDKYDDTPLLLAAGSDYSFQLMKEMICSFLMISPTVNSTKTEANSTETTPRDEALRLPNVLLHEPNQNNVTAFSSLGQSYVDATSRAQLLIALKEDSLKEHDMLVEDDHDDDDDNCLEISEDWKKALLFVYHSALHAKFITLEEMPSWTVLSSQQQQQEKNNNYDTNGESNNNDEDDKNRATFQEVSDSVLQQKDQNSKNDKQKETRTNHGNDDATKRYYNPLHLACRMNTPFVLIQTMCRFFPEWCIETDFEGNTPLHYAAAAPIYIDVSTPVLEDEHMDMIEPEQQPHPPPAAAAAAGAGAGTNNENDRNATIATAASGSAMSMDGEGSASSFNDGWSDMDDDEEEKDKTQNNNSSSNLLPPSPTVIDILMIHGLKQAANVPNQPHKRLPLAIALAHGKTLDDGLRSMILSCPQVLDTIDVQTNMYPVMIAATAATSSSSSDATSKKPVSSDANHVSSTTSSTTDSSTESRSSRSISSKMFIPSPFVKELPTDAKTNDILALGTVYELIRALPQLISFGL